VDDFFCTKFCIYIFTADKSCCGALNSRTIQVVVLFIKSIITNSNNTLQIYFFGISGLNLLKRRFSKFIKSTFFNFELNKSGYPFNQSFSIFHIICFDFDRLFIFFNLYTSRLIQKCGKYEVSSYEIL
jgi:F0F1-type ATP synthase gamma subunit